MVAEARLAHGPKSVEFGDAFAAATQTALETFAHYWNPLNIEEITERVPNDGWLPRQSYSELRSRGLEALRKYADLVRFDDHELLATEYGFLVPIEGTWDEDEGRPHYLAGSVDRLAVRYFSRKEAVCIDDHKTGREQTHLRQNLQFTAYCFATTVSDFWTGGGAEDGFGHERGMELYERFRDVGRRGTWINLRTFKYQDAGWRGPKDYERFKLAVTQLAMAIKADIFPLSISGATCTYCSFRDICGGTGVAADDEGDPRKLLAPQA